MQEILKELHKYVPNLGEGMSQTYCRQGVVGDQLTVERGVNGLLQLENGFTPKERMEGLHFEIADFHGGMTFMQFRCFYGIQSMQMQVCQKLCECLVCQKLCDCLGVVMITLGILELTI